MSLRLFDFMTGEQLHIFVHPEYLLLLLIDSKQVVVRKQLLQLEVALERYREMNSWEPVLSRLQTQLASDEWKNIKTHVVISNHFVRYTTIPWNAGLNSQEEQLAYLKHCFVKRYGDAAKLWALRMSVPDFEQPALASGISETFLQQLQGCCSHAGLRVSSIQPHLMFALNQSLAEVDERSFCFAMVEVGRVCIAIIQHGILQSVTDYSAEADIAEQIETLIKRESILLNIDTENWPIVYWSASSGKDACFTRKAVINIANFYSLDTVRSHEYSVALNG